MSLTARIIAQAALPGPTLLELFHTLAHQSGDLALLHSGTFSPPSPGQRSVLACQPVLTLEIDPTGQPRWITHQDLSLADLSLPTQAANPAHLWQQMLDQIILLPGQTVTQDETTTLNTPASIHLIGWLGGISYDLGRHLENIPTLPTKNPSLTTWPLFRWTLYDGYFVLDHASGLWTIATLEWSTLRPEPADQRLDRLASILATVEPSEETPSTTPAPAVVTPPSPEAYQQGVAQVREYIAAGDIYQANLAHAWQVQTPADPAAIYTQLQKLSPAPYAAFFRFDNKAIVSASPELFLTRGISATPTTIPNPALSNLLCTRPIKGTRPRDPSNPQRDQAFKHELLTSEKDQAELAMIVDLLRNDLGRICEFGSVRILEPRLLTQHPTVWHTEAIIEGTLAPVQWTNGNIASDQINPPSGLAVGGEGGMTGEGETGGTWGAIITAMCPGGSITGAPKIRAMQIIEELESANPHAGHRAWYCGHLGWIGPRETGILNIAIRTILMEQLPTNSDHWQAQVWAGAGIVADSDPQAEYEETHIKARAMLQALGIF